MQMKSGGMSAKEMTNGCEYVSYGYASCFHDNSEEGIRFDSFIFSWIKLKHQTRGSGV